jgi:predicted DNA-binding transcriptional regulator
LSKDQALGAFILVVCVLIAILYGLTLFYPQWLINLGLAKDIATFGYSTIQFWILAIPVFIAFVAVMFIGAWIGWTMATTPPPKPIETTSETKETEESK